MGFPVSVVVANLYMEFFEELALETALTRPRLWKRYVEDTFCILRKGSTKELLHHLNRVRSTIKFTVDQEEDGTLPFLNTLLRRREDGSPDVSVYRKPMHMNLYISPLRVSSSDPHEEKCVEMSPQQGHRKVSACRTTFGRKMATLESPGRMITLQTLSATLPPHPHRKQPTQAAVMRNRRRREDHWW